MTLFNKTIAVQASAPVTFEIAAQGEVVIESNGAATLTRADGVTVATFEAAGRQQLKVRQDTYTLTGDNVRVTIREISPAQGGHFGSVDGKPIEGVKHFKPEYHTR
jgi:hypothetical protein